jgi:putative membrane protein
MSMEASINTESKNEKKYFLTIVVVSVLIPIVVAVLLYLPEEYRPKNLEVRSFPHINAVLNTLTSFCLVAGFIFIKNKNIKTHRFLMMTAFVLSSVFLVLYVVYHSSPHASVKFGDVNGDKILDEAELVAVGMIRSIYLFVLITHIILAAVVVPFVLFSIYFALTKQIAKHKRLVKWTFPIWLYVAVTGVIVYLMISPYYQL